MKWFQFTFFFGFYILILITAEFIQNPYNEHVRIIGGNTAEISDFPFTVAIYTTTNLGTYFCGGAIISDQWILTAAHCIHNAVSFQLQVGSSNLKEPDEKRLIIAANLWVIHPDFDENTLINNVGLIKIPNALTFNNLINTIALPSSGLEDHTVVTAIGWGQISDQMPGPVDILQKVTLITLLNENCKYTYGNQITDNMVCAAGSFNEGTCIGDMGGPLIQYINGKATHVGIASFLSFNGCESVDPSGYTRTFNYAPWIKNITNIK